MTLCETNKSSIFLWSESCQFTNYLLKIECPLTSESNEKNKMGNSENVEEIDLILGGHDHVYELETVSGKKNNNC